MSGGSPEVVEALRTTLKERDRLRRENQRLRAGATEPIAIVGMACRYPGGVGSSEDLWELVAEGRDVISEFPTDRGWDVDRLYNPDPESFGTSYTREAGFLTDAGDFDADFFAISPREAEFMDPQERLLLESCWEALEDAGIDPASLKRTQTGVFAGVGERAYGPAAGMTSSIISGRVSYALGLEGPAISIDTACSSSLVALHLASQALRQGECTLALSGGVTVLSSPGAFISFSAQRGLAPDGRCKSFAEAADGVAWAEGVGMLVLERLSDATRNGHRVLALLKGSAVNQDGASNGLTAPNGPSQERVIRQALASAELTPQDVDVVEGHGTGTTLGDPIEAGALLATYGQERERPLKLGSIKSNIGHSQAAAGVAGVIKMALAMREGVLPKTLHVDAPSSKVDWESGQIELLSEQLEWDSNGRPRRAGVSSFGISGTNAHVIVEEAPEVEPAPITEPLQSQIPLALSAKAEPALAEAAERLAVHLRENPELDPTDVAYSLLTTRSALEHRAVVLGADREELLAGLASLAGGEPSPNVTGARAKDGKLAYLFTGQGSQRLGMGRELYDSAPDFAAAFDAVCEQLDQHLEIPLEEIVFAKGKEAAARLEDTAYAQPALFAIELALYEALAKRGLKPDLLAGHSVGEIVAAHVAGAIELEDAAKLVAARGRLMGALPAGGAMAAIEASEEEARESIAGKESELAIAAINGPTSIVISGAEDAVEAVRTSWEEKGRKTKRLAVSHAFHSPLMEPMLEEFGEIATSLTYGEPKIPIVSNVSGALLDPEQATDPAYWVGHVREAVRFADAIATLQAQGTSTYLELGPDPVLCAMARESLGEDAEAAFVPTLREGRPEANAISTAIAAAHAAGAKPDWGVFFEGTGAKRVPLPTYPFQRRRYWFFSPTAAGDASAIGQSNPGHPLLAATIEGPSDGGLTLTGRLSLATHPWLAEHVVAGAVLLPGTAFLELALRAGEEAQSQSVEELVLEAPLVFQPGGAVAIQVSVSGRGEDGRREIAIHSRPEGGVEELADGSAWTRHAQGTLTDDALPGPAPLDSWPPEGAEPLEVEYLYEGLTAAGLEYGPTFQGLSAAWRKEESVYVEVSLPEEAYDAERFAIHPALLDSALHGIALAASEDSSGPKLPFSWSGVSLQAVGARALRATISPEGEGAVSLALADGAGAPVAGVASLALRPLSSAQREAAGGPDDGLLRIEWSEASLGEQEEVPAEVEVLRCRIEHGDGLAEAAHAAAKSALRAVQDWLADEEKADLRLALITEGAMATAEDDSADPAAATIWGLIRSAQSEHPGRFALVDSDGSEASQAALPAALAIGIEEPQIALREGRALVPRLARARAEESGEGEDAAASIDPGRTVLIVGATGALGALVARHLAEHHGARHLLLVSRGGPEAEGATELRAELEERGARATIAACDAADRGALESLLATIPAEHPLGAVVHCAGTLADGTVETMDAEQVDRVFAAKVDAAWNLHELTAERDPTVFLLFSAVAGTFGAPGQANYAAANVFLDSLAQKRRAEGLPATSIAWGLWERGGGMASELGEADLARMRRGGIEALSDERGLTFFDAALGGDRAAVVAVPLNTAGLRGLASVGALPPIFRGLVRVPRRRSVAAAGSFATQLATLPEAEAEGVVLELVRGEVAGVLGHSSAQEIEPGRAFQELGFDSLAAVELRNRLSAIAGLRLPATVVFDYPSSAALAEYVLGEVGAGGVVKQVAVRAQASEEPIAIVGMACRYPGGISSPEELWQLVAEGRDGISRFPVDRGWDVESLYDPDPDNPGTSYTREGGFLAEVGDFDAEFFGISPREALFTDPQQRLLLESCWEALEDAGIEPASLRKTQTGVFAGVMYQDYGLTPGGTSSVVSGRISYTLGLEGPAITVDTACSSSLVAMHLASQALRQGECTLALAGGVTALATPTVFVEFSRQRGLAADGRSKSFAEAADGVAWGEGVGVLVLERLSEARRNGHPVLALLKGSAVNQDGASNGLTAPNGPSQERVIRQALANARLEPGDVQVVEGHGTGTTLGDPIEAGALLATYGQDREQPLRLGSIKSNIGHTQAAAGVAGVIKMTEAMRQGVMPKTLHVDAPSSNVDWEAGEIELLSESVEWEADGGPRRAGISSFGISGTNAHVILEEAPEPGASEGGGEAPATAPVQGSIPLVLSAKAEPALAEVAERLAAQLAENPELDLTDVAYSLATTRSAFEHRAVALGADREELLAALASLADGDPSPNVLSARARDGKLAYLFTGQGSQRLGMGKELYESDPNFQAAFDLVCEQLDSHLETPLKEIVFAKGKKAAARLEDTTYAQPALFAIEVALYEALAKRGLKPDLLAGHSIGEIAAAHVAGVIELDDAAKLVAARGRLMGVLPEGGAMAAIEATEQEAAESIAGKESELAIAAINGPTSTVISGTEEAVEAVRTQWEEKGRKTKRLAVSHAFHSPLMEPMLAEFAEIAASLTYGEPKIPIVSNVSGALLDPEQATDPAYWVAHVREAVRFADAVSTLRAQGANTYLELGPDPVLCAMAREILGEDAEAAFVPTLREGRPEVDAIPATVAQAHAAGAKPAWGVFFEGTGAKRVPLPTYPFQRERYWLASGAGAADASAIGLTAAEHPLLGAAVELASGEGEGLLLTGRLSLATHPWLADHLVGETVLLPGTAFLELALRAAEQVGAETVEELTLQAPLVLPEAGAVAIQVAVSAPDESGRREVAIHSRREGADEGWAQNAAGALAEQPAVAPESLGAWPPDGADPVEVEYLYDLLAEHGLRYGPAFQCLTAAWRDGEQIYVEVSLPEEQEWAAEHFAIHPALLDAVLHGIALASSQEPHGARLPFSWAGVSLQAAGARALRARISPAGEGEVSLALADGAGAPLARVGSLVLRPLAPGQLQAPVQPAEGLLTVEWAEAGLPEHEAMPPGVETLRCETGGDPGAASAREAAQSALRAVQDWLADEEKADLRLALITEGAMATAEDDSPDPAAATIWGLVRSAQSEHPGRFALIDSDGSEASQAALPAALAIGIEEPQLALREGRALAPRVARTPVAETDEQAPPAIDPGRTVLITGATGGLGALVARHLAEHHGARHLLLVSRSGPEAGGAERLRAELEALGAEALISACDVSDRAALETLLAAIPAGRPLGAVIHCAGALADGTVEAMEAEQIDRVFAAKVDAAWNLHELTAELDLSEFLLFSSVAGTLGAPGQANYAAANLFLDTLAQKRRAEGLPATSIAWGLWERGGGMASELGEADLARMRRGGIEALSDERGLALFDAALGGERATALALPLDTAGLRGLASVGALPPIFRGLVRVPRRRSAATGSLATKLATLPGAEAESIVLELVRGEVAAVLGHASGQEIEPGRAFQELGFDSLAAVELRNRLSAIAGLRLAATVVFDYPNAAALAEHLLAEATAGGGVAEVAVRARASEEPIAIVGMACRYPGGVSSPAELWRMVAEGRDGISGFPVDRGWDVERIYNPDPDNPGTSYTREGGFLAAAGDFDPEFFGIAPREALVTDPQQRLLLESCWEALEEAGIDPASLRKSQTGVFAGVMYQDYGPAPGMTQSIVSGRIAYTLGLEGPAISVDTACSSSLVAMHLASQALLQGECGLALAGGVTVLSTPSVFVEFSRQRGLAPDGRSKSFSESADGVAWAEGVGMLVLERLSDAERNGHPVLALLKGSAVNQDGASNGLTAPNGPSQERVIRQALANARLEAKDVDVVEGHGTGTTLGDPIEAGALLATYGQERERPLKLGSIKSNIGHTQAAAGVAGVIKMTEAMRQGVMPKTLHLDAPSSKVDWESGEIELLSEPVEWEANGGPRRAGVSSFGISGTNAHVILEEAPESVPVPVAEPFQGPVPLALSAKVEPALAEVAERLAAHLTENPDLDPTDIAYSLATTRSTFEHRAVALGADRDELLAALASLADGEPSPNVLSARAKDGKLAYLFTGQGSQRLGMGKELYDSDPNFAAAFDRVCGQFDLHLEAPLKEIVFAKGKKAAAQLEDTTYAQPALFAIEVALFEALAKRGLKPDVLAGHSIGEIAAAHVAGAIELGDAAKLVAARGRLMGALPAGGAMAAIEATEQETAESIAGREGELAIAAINGPTSTVISGSEEAVEQVRSAWEEKGRKTKRLAVSHAFHSPLMEPMLDEFGELAESLTYSEPKIPIVSNVTGELLAPEQATDPAYWVGHVREAVRFADAIATLQGQGASTYVELGPDPVLCAMARESLGDDATAAFVPTLREGRAEAAAVSTAIAGAHAAGAKLDWDVFFAGTHAKRVPLPTYPFQRASYWLTATPDTADAGTMGLASAQHPLLGAAVDLAGEEKGLLFTGRLSLSTHAWLADHMVAGAVLLPGTAFLELALRAAEEAGAEGVEELTLLAPLVLPAAGAVALQIAVSGPGEGGRREIAIHSRPDSGVDDLGEAPEWIRHAEGALSTEPAPVPEPLPAWPPEGAEPLGVEHLYDGLAAAGLEYGPVFQGLTAAWKDGDRIYAEVSLPEESAQDAERFGIHPALLDSALHGSMLGGGEGKGVSLPFSWRKVSLATVGASELRVAIDVDGETLALRIGDREGAPVATIGSMIARPLDPGRLRTPDTQVDGLLALAWTEAAMPEVAEPPPGVEALHCAPEGGPGMAEAARTAAQGALESIQRWLSEESKAGTRLAFVTSGAMATRGDEAPDPAAAAIWGLIRSAQSEHPGRFALIDSDGSEASRAALPAALAIGIEEPQLALRDGVALVPRAAGLGDAEDEKESRPIDPERTVLITGATGALGALTARHFAERHGARHLLLVSRSGLEAEGAAELKGELEALGAEVTIAACDVADREALGALLAAVPEPHPLGAVIHCAGVLADGTVEAMGSDQIERVFVPKVDAAWNLHELSVGSDLSAFVLFSSAAGTLGGPGQANYAAANVFLDALAQKRRAEGLPATSIAWGLWEQQGGMISDLEEADRARMRRGGVEMLSREKGLSLLDAALGSERAALLAIPFNPAGLRALASAGALAPILSGLVRVPRRRRAASGSLAAKLASLPPAEREQQILDLVRAEAAFVLGYDSATAVEPDQPFRDLGFDSLSAVELRNRLNVAFGLSLAATLVFDHPTAAELATHLAGQAQGTEGDAAPPRSMFAWLGREAGGEEKSAELIDLIGRAAMLRPSFDSPLSAEEMPKADLLADGPESPRLLLLPSIMPSSGPAEYTQLAAQFRGERSVLALRLPGFGEGEPLPADASLALRNQTEAIRRLDPGPEFALVAHSSGGWFAQAAAAQLEDAGTPPLAVILIDTYFPPGGPLLGLRPEFLARWWLEQSVVPADDARLTATMSYFRIFADWRPPRIESPIVAIRAGDPLADMRHSELDDPAASGSPTNTLVEVPGDHFSIIATHAETTARAIRQALAAQTTDKQPERG